MLFLPLAIILTAMVLSWHRQTIDFRDVLSEELTARSGFELAMLRLGREQLEIAPGKSSSFPVSGLGGPSGEVRIRRQADTVLSLSGSVLEPAEAAEADLEAIALDPDGRQVRLYMKLEVYLVEVNVSARPSLLGVRLRGVLIRREDGTVSPAGLDIERGFF
jgi:hypothetical protein